MKVSDLDLFDRILLLIIAFCASIGGFLCGFAAARSAPYFKAEPVEVCCIAVHIYGESPAAGTLSEHFTYMTAERLDTKERRNFCEIYGQPGEVFRMDWNSRHYSP